MWDIMLDGPFIPTTEVKDREITQFVLKTCQQYNREGIKKIEKSCKAKKLLVCVIKTEQPIVSLLADRQKKVLII